MNRPGRRSARPMEWMHPPAPPRRWRKAEVYSREIEPLMAKRSGQASSPSHGATGASTSPPPQASMVQWMDPAELRLTDSPTQSGDSREAVPVRAVIQVSASEANQVASIAPTPGATHVDVAANVPARDADEPSTRPTNSSGMQSSQAAARLLEKLARRVRESPRDVSGHFEYQLLQFLLDEQVPQLSTLASLPTEDREMLTAVLDGLSLFRNTLRSDNNMLLSKKIRPLLEMSERLRAQADLTIPTVALCHSVDGFGKYDPIEPARFTQGVDHRTVIYCEIANFSSVLNADHLYETRLKQDMTLYTEGGFAVWSDKTEQISDTARVRRQDFFVNKRLVIPASLTIGRYLLKVTIVDQQANRVAEASVPIVITAK